ncbi:MAG: hypothetical protein M3325_14665, partial [Actinomycetota bacterium]|nr:hypothetical protein [Actinomycetota bacterium]
VGLFDGIPGARERAQSPRAGLGQAQQRLACRARARGLGRGGGSRRRNRCDTLVAGRVQAASAAAQEYTCALGVSCHASSPQWMWSQ